MVAAYSEGSEDRGSSIAYHQRDSSSTVRYVSTTHRTAPYEIRSDFSPPPQKKPKKSCAISNLVESGGERQRTPNFRAPKPCSLKHFTNRVENQYQARCEIHMRPHIFRRNALKHFRNALNCSETFGARACDLEVECEK
eukprot:1644509-Rhodomonas_salina.2